MSKIVDDKTLNAIIKETLGLKKEASERMDESYVVSSKSYELNTDLLSKKAIDANLRLMQQNIDNLNEISARLDSADTSSANSCNSAFRNLKVDETYNINSAFLSAYYFDNIADPTSKITMDSMAYMRLNRDFGTFDDWQKDFIACGLSSRDGWAVTVYNCFLNRYMNIVVDSDNLGIPMNCYPVIVLKMNDSMYFKDYLDDKKKYIFAMMKELNWDVVEKRFKRAEKLSKIFTQPLGGQK